MLGSVYHSSLTRTNNAVAHHERMLEERQSQRRMQERRTARQISITPDDETLFGEFNRLVSDRKGLQAKPDRFHSNMGLILSLADDTPYEPTPTAEKEKDLADGPPLDSPARKLYPAPLYLIDRQPSPRPQGPILVAAGNAAAEEATEEDQLGASQRAFACPPSPRSPLARLQASARSSLFPTSPSLSTCGGCGRPASAPEPPSENTELFLQRLDASKAEKVKTAFETKITQCREVISHFKQQEQDDLLGDFKVLKAQNRFFRKERVELYRKLYGRYLKQMVPAGYIFDDEACDSHEEQAQREAYYKEEMEMLKERQLHSEQHLNDLIAKLRKAVHSYRTQADSLCIMNTMLENASMEMHDADACSDNTTRNGAALQGLEDHVISLEDEVQALTQQNQDIRDELECAFSTEMHKVQVAARQNMDAQSDDYVELLRDEETQQRAAIISLQRVASDGAKLSTKIAKLEHEKCDVLDRLHSERVSVALLTSIAENDLSAKGAEEMAHDIIGNHAGSVPEDAVASLAGGVTKAMCKAVTSSISAMKRLQPHLARSDAQSAVNDFAEAVRSSTDSFVFTVKDSMDEFLHIIKGLLDSAASAAAAANTAMGQPKGSQDQLTIFEAFPSRLSETQEQLDVNVRGLMSTKPARRPTRTAANQWQEMPPDLLLEFEVETVGTELASSESFRATSSLAVGNTTPKKKRRKSVSPGGADRTKEHTVAKVVDKLRIKDRSDKDKDKDKEKEKDKDKDKDKDEDDECFNVKSGVKLNLGFLKKKMDEQEEETKSPRRKTDRRHSSAHNSPNSARTKSKGQTILKRALRLSTAMQDTPSTSTAAASPAAPPAPRKALRTVAIQVEDLALQRLMRSGHTDNPNEGSSLRVSALHETTPTPAPEKAVSDKSRVAMVLKNLTSVARGDEKWLELRRMVCSVLTESVAAIAEAKQTGVVVQADTAQKTGLTPRPSVAPPTPRVEIVEVVKDVVQEDAEVQTELIGECTSSGGPKRRHVMDSVLRHSARLEATLMLAEDEWRWWCDLAGQKPSPQQALADAIEQTTIDMEEEWSARLDDAVAQERAEQEETRDQKVSSLTAELGVRMLEEKIQLTRECEEKLLLAKEEYRQQTESMALELKEAAVREKQAEEDRDSLKQVRTQLEITANELDRLMNEKGNKIRALQAQVRNAEIANTKQREEYEKKLDSQITMHRNQLQDERAKTKRQEDLVIKLKVTREASLRAAEVRMRDECENIRKQIEKECKRNVQDVRQAQDKSEHLLRREIKILQLGSRGAAAAASEYVEELKKARDDYEKLYDKLILEKESHYKTQDEQADERRASERLADTLRREAKLLEEKLDVERLVLAKAKKDHERRMEDATRSFNSVMEERDHTRDKLQQANRQISELTMQLEDAADHTKQAHKMESVHAHKMMACATREKQQLMDVSRDRITAMERTVLEVRSRARQEKEQLAVRLSEARFWTDHAHELCSRCVHLHRLLFEVMNDVKVQGNVEFVYDEPLELSWASSRLKDGLATRTPEDVLRIFSTMTDMLTRDETLLENFRKCILGVFDQHRRRRLNSLFKGAVGDVITQNKQEAVAKIAADRLQTEEMREKIRTFGTHTAQPTFAPDKNNLGLTGKSEFHGLTDKKLPPAPAHMAAITQKQRPATSGPLKVSALKSPPKKKTNAALDPFKIFADVPAAMPRQDKMLPVLAKSLGGIVESTSEKVTTEVTKSPKRQMRVGTKGPSLVINSSSRRSPPRSAPGLTTSGSFLLKHHNPLNPHLPPHVVHSIPTAGAGKNMPSLF